MSSYFHIVVMDITLIPGMHQELKTVQRDKNVEQFTIRNYTFNKNNCLSNGTITSGRYCGAFLVMFHLYFILFYFLCQPPYVVLLSCIRCFHRILRYSVVTYCCFVIIIIVE